MENKIDFVDMHLHTEYSNKDGMIRTLDHDEPKKVKEDIIQIAEERGHGIITATDHGVMSAHGDLALAAYAFGMKHIIGCEFYMAAQPKQDCNQDDWVWNNGLMINSRHYKSFERRGEAYYHLNAWAKNWKGYQNLCSLMWYSYYEGFYHEPRIDLELIDKYGDDIIWSGACIGGPVDQMILKEDFGGTMAMLNWFQSRFGDDFILEYHNHDIPDENTVNDQKVGIAESMGITIIAATDAHYRYKDDMDAHANLLAINFNKETDHPNTFGFKGKGYHILSANELRTSFKDEYIKNTMIIANRCDGNVLKPSKEIFTPKFSVPEWFENGGVEQWD